MSLAKLPIIYANSVRKLPVLGTCVRACVCTLAPVCVCVFVLYACAFGHVRIPELHYQQFGRN